MKTRNIVIPILSGVVCGGAGFAVGAVVTRKHWQKKTDDEIRAIKELYYSSKPAVKAETNTEAKKPAKKAPKTKSEKEFGTQVTEAVKDYTKMYKPKDDEVIEVSNELVRTPEVKQEDIIYYVTDTDYATSLYDAQELTFYDDGVITDGDGNELYPDDIKDATGDLINQAAFSHSDVVYIRNDAKEIDYEVTYDNRKYADVKKLNPNKMR